MLDLSALPIDPQRLQARIDQLGAIGVHPNGGLFRTLYDDGWVEAMALLKRWLEEAGLTTRFDAVGNLSGRAEGTDGGDAVVTGSHVDTVRQGGKYDGALGVHMAIAAVQALLESAGQPRRPLEVLVTCEEEGSRFASSFWGARALVGRVKPEEAEKIADADGVTIGAAMRELGFDPAGSRRPSARTSPRSLRRTSSRAPSWSARGTRWGWSPRSQGSAGCRSP